jgi:SAM-dependent methyltransferase
VSDTLSQVQAYYNPADLKARIQAALARLAPADQPLTVAQLAALDQFHTRGIKATAELAASAGITADTRVLDLGCGLGGPARYLAQTFGCRVTGLDLSPGVIEAGIYLTERCGLSRLVTLQAGNALQPPFADDTFDVVFLLHVVMNIEDRAALYGEIRRVLAPGGRLVSYDLVLRGADVVYPVPWARDASTSFLLSDDATRKALESCGFRALLWRDDTAAALEWFKAMADSPPPGGLNPGIAIGEGFSVPVGNLGGNLHEGRLGLLAAVVARD